MVEIIECIAQALRHPYSSSSRLYNLTYMDLFLQILICLNHLVESKHPLIRYGNSSLGQNNEPRLQLRKSLHDGLTQLIGTHNDLKS
jgi:hypothetical protein